MDEQFTTTIPTHKWTPRSCRGDFAREVTYLWTSVTEEASEEAWIKVLISPRYILAANAPKRSTNQATNPQARRGRKRGNPTEDTEEQERGRGTRSTAAPRRARAR